ncbi:MAG: hypothetical protein R3Y09_07690 [Clostridia bacterium]
MESVYGNTARKRVYEYQPEEKTEYKTQVKLETKMSKKARVRLLKLCNIALVLTIATCAFSLLYSYTKVTVLTKEISTLSSQLEVLQSQEISLNAQIDQMFNLETVEEYAINTLGMIKLDQNQIEQVHIQNTDVIESYDDVSTSQIILNQVKNIFTSVWEYIN